MRSEATTPDEYIAGLPEERRAGITQLRNTIRKNLPEGFREVMAHGMIAWVVPKETYPPGYHVDPTKPLMLLSLASQKGHIAVHHMALYADGPLLGWFNREWPNHSKKKLDMGKSCLRFKKPDDIPYELIGELASKLTPQDWIETYEAALSRR